MDSNSKSANTADARREQFRDIVSSSGDWNTGSPASTAMKTPTKAGTKCNKAIPDDSAAADLSDKSSGKKRTAARARLEESDPFQDLPPTPYAAYPSPPTKRPRSMSNSPRAASPLPSSNKMDAMLVVGRENYTRYGMSHKGAPFCISSAAIARVSPALMEEIADYYPSDEELSNGQSVTRPVALPTGRPVWYLPNEDARDMKVLLDVIHDDENAVVGSLFSMVDVKDRLPKAWRVAKLAEKYKMAHRLQHYVRPWFNSLKQNLTAEARMEFLEIHRFLNQAAMKEEQKAAANKWGIKSPETTNHSQQLPEHSSESEAEPRDLADIHAENVLKAAAEGSETTLPSHDNLPLRSRRRDARTDHY